MNASFAHRRQPRRRGLGAAIILLAALLLLPSLAGLRLAQSFDLRAVLGYFVAVSGFTYWLYRHDKSSAEAGRWRTPESTLHLAELFGGWPAAFLAQRILRHKISKTRYQVAFWTIVMLHEALSLDFLSGWHYSQTAFRLFDQ